MCKETGVQLEKAHWYGYVTRLAEKYLERKTIMVWNQQVQIDRTAPNNRTDIIMHDIEKATCILTKLNSVALVRERTIPTERPPPVGEISANFCG